jgi:two-component system chemotaxis response regulator CheB
VTKALIVDDSAVVRKVISDELSKYDDVEVVDTAVDPYVARDKIVQLHPDVLTLDIEMPRIEMPPMDGLTFLARLMKYDPLPIIIVSSLTPKGSQAALRALEIGAVDVIDKSSQYSAPTDFKRLARSIRAAAVARPVRMAPPVESNQTEAPVAVVKTTHKVLVIGASTGGAQAIEAVLLGLPASTPGTVIVQHMPAGFTTTFSARLNRICRMTVREAKDGDDVVRGVALADPGNFHMVLRQSGARYFVRVKDGPGRLSPASCRGRALPVRRR